MLTPRNLLWVDGLAGATVGVALLAASGWLQPLYRLPTGLYFTIGIANVAYGCYSVALASRSRRPATLILLLVAANTTWGLLCARWALVYASSAGVLGLGHLVAEAVVVTTLASFEWRWRKQLQAV